MVFTAKNAGLLTKLTLLHCLLQPSMCMGHRIGHVEEVMGKPLKVSKAQARLFAGRKFRNLRATPARIAPVALDSLPSNRKTNGGIDVDSDSEQCRA